MSNSSKQHPAYFQLLRTFQQSKTHLSIANLYNYLIAQDSHIFSSFLQIPIKKLRSLQHIRKLTLDLNEAQLAPISLNRLYKSLIKNLHSIQSFKITLSDRDFFEESLDFLLKTLRSFPYLKTFEIILTNTQERQITQKHFLTHVIKRLKKSCPRLQNVEISFINHFLEIKTHRNSPKIKGWKIQGLANLQSLTLNLPKTAFLAWENKAEGKIDLSGLKRFTKLKSLELAFRGLVSIQGPYGYEFTFDPRGLFPMLKSFKGGFFHGSFREMKEFLILKRAFESHYSLEEFTLKFKQLWELSDLMILNLFQILVCLKTDLKQLHFSSLQGELTSKGSELLIAVFGSPRLRKIEVFCLEFVDCEGVNDEFFVKLSQVISQNMTGLRFLRLRFELRELYSKGWTGFWERRRRGKGITDKGLRKFAGNLAAKSGNLELVSLEFGRFGKISDKGVKGLCEDLSKIESLKKVTLRFRFCGEVSTVGEKFAREKLGEKKEVKFALV